MLVEKELIKKAKEKLGDENAVIISGLLQLEDYDEKNLKACCPYHNEDTASFIYNKRNQSFHCFGCGKTVDIIDVLMGRLAMPLMPSQVSCLISPSSRPRSSFR